MRRVKGLTLSQRTPRVKFSVAWSRWFHHSDDYDDGGLRLKSHIPIDAARETFEANLPEWLKTAGAMEFGYLPHMADLLGLELPPEVRETFLKRFDKIRDQYAEWLDNSSDGYGHIDRGLKEQFDELCNQYDVETPARFRP